MRVHVADTGKMGLPMARLLQGGGHVLSISDPDPERLRLARAEGLEVMASDAGIAAAECILSSLPHDAAFLEFGGRVVRHVRATVSGNNHMAEAAQLTVMASGPREAYDAALPLLRLRGPQQFWLGEGEQARLMKLVVNLMIVQTSAMLAEALALGRKGGLGWQDMLRVLAASAVGSPILKAKAVQLAERDFSPTFTVEQMLKDVALILDAGAQARVPLPLTAITGQLLQAAMAQGSAGEDYAAIIKAVERASDLPDL